MSKQPEQLGFYATPEHACSYLPEQKATTLFADPNYPKNKQLYSALASIGFRRSGEHVYQPYCQRCNACVPIRLDVNRFRASRNQRRNLKLNKDLHCHVRTTAFHVEHFQLYKKYIASRHAGGGMDNPTESSYLEFLTADWADSRFLEFRCGDKLIAVAVIDLMDDALSAVYTWFDPDEAARSPGRYAILYEIGLAREYQYRWLYLGYWIGSCNKMSYKTEYKPYQCYLNNQWLESTN